MRSVTLDQLNLDVDVKSLCLRTCALDYIMGGVLQWGFRDMLQPSDPTREKKKRKIFQTLFFFLFMSERKDFLLLERELGKI